MEPGTVRTGSNINGSVKAVIKENNNTLCLIYSVGRDGVIGLATCYGLDGPGIEPWRSEVFRTLSERPWGLFSLQYNGYRDSFPGVKRPERGVDNPHSSRAEVKETVGL